PLHLRVRASAVRLRPAALVFHLESDFEMRVPFARAALVVAAKDLRIELRTREVTTTTGYFAVLVAILASLSYTAGPKTTERVAPGTIWLSLAFTAVLAIGRFWQREREDGAFLALRTAPIARSAIFAGKAIVLLVFLLIVEIIVVPIVALVF